MPAITANQAATVTLKQVLVACHLLLCASMEQADKHYEARLRESFRLFRQSCAGEYDDLLAALPNSTNSLESYAHSVSRITAAQTNSPALDILKRSLEGALAGSGGYTRQTGEAALQEVVGRREHAIEDADVHGRIIQNQTALNRSNQCSKLRLATDEAASGTVHYQSKRNIIPSRGDSASQAARAAKGRKASIERQNQLQGFGWARLSLFDIQQWHIALPGSVETAVAQLGLPTDEVLAMISLMFWLGRSPETIREMRIVLDYSCLPTTTIRDGYLVVSPIVAVLPRYHADGAKEVSKNWAAYVHESADRIYLPLPKATRRHLAPLIRRRTPTGSRGMRLFQQESKSLTQAVRETLAYLRHKTGTRVTATRLIRQMPITVANHRGDRVVAATTMGIPVGNHTFAGAYYYSAPQSDLAKNYWRSASPLSSELMSDSTPEPMPPLPRSASSKRVGSNVCPDDGAKIAQQTGFYGYYVQDLQAALSYTRTRRHEPAFTVAFHNIYTTYCISMLAAATGYRAVKQPLQDIRALDCTTGWLVISDKDFSDHRHTRLVWVPAILSRQLEAYATYRSVITRVLGIASESAGFFFFLNEARQNRPVAPHSLAAAIHWTNKLPLNANRHFLRTRLTERRVPGEVIDAYMGHWDLGERPYGPYSALSPRDFKNDIAPALDEILDKQGWRIEYAIKPAAAALADAPIASQAAQTTKQAQPPKSYVKASRDRDLARLDEVLNQLQPRLLQRIRHLKLDDKDIDALFDALRSDTTIRDWRYVHNTLVRRLESGTEELDWRVKIPAPVVVLNRPPAPFTPSAFRELAVLRKLEPAFGHSLHQLAPRSRDIDSVIAAYTKPSKHLKRKSDLATLLVGQILFSAARYGGLVSRKSIQALASQLDSGGMKIRDHLTFDLAPRGHVKRWYADPLTAVLILRYRSLVEAHQIQPAKHPVDHILRVFVRGLAQGEHHVDSITPFLEAASTAWRLNQPAFVYRWSQGFATSVSWDEKTEMRVRFGRRLKREVEDKHADAVDSVSEPKLESARQTGITSNRSRSCDLNRAYRDLYRCLHVRRGKSWRGQISKQVTDWVTANKDRVGLVPILMAHWIIEIALQKSKTHAAIGAASSLRTYVSRIGRDIFVASKKFPDDDCAETTPWAALYRATVDAKRGDNARRAAAAECQGFHDFVIRTLDVPPLDVGEAVGVGAVSISVSVNANYITPDEVMQAESWLAQAGNTNQRYEIARQALTLAYWSGLRIGELSGLRLKDVQIVWSSEGALKRADLLVRTHYQRALKTDTSRRRIPLSSIMPKTQLHHFIEFFRQREQHCEDLSPTGAAFLFATSGLESHMPDQDDIRNVITHVLRNVTGDDSVVFHHLRHSAANNWLLAMLAQSDAAPLWNLFPKPPEPLLDVSSRINRGLMINPNRRRGILYAVATLLGHSDPSVTLQSYIHILPWICATATESADASEIYIDMTRDVSTDASLLNKSPNAATSWRSRHGKDISSFQPLADHWLQKCASSIMPPAYKNTEPADQAATLKIELPARPVPSPYLPYRIAMYAEQYGLAEAPGPSNALPAQIAKRVGEPLWLVTGLLANMRYWGNLPAGRKTKAGRISGNNRFQSSRKKHLRGHGRNSPSTLSQNPEIPGLMPAPPHTELERRNCADIWKRLTALLQATGRWDRLTKGENATPANGADHHLLEKGLDVFLNASNSTDHTMKFFKAGPQAAHHYLALVLKICPHNRVLVEVKPPPGVSDAKAVAGVRKQFGLTNVKCVAVAPTTRAYPKWPHGLPSVKLLSAPYDKTTQPRASYGAWFALFSFALLYNTVSIAAKDVGILHPLDLLDTNNTEALP